MTVDEDAIRVLTEAVNKMTSTVSRLSNIMENDYPKRPEIERKYVSKLQSQKATVRLAIGALIGGFVVFAATLSTYSSCFVGDNSPGICKLVPGYQERIDRRDEIDVNFQRLDLEIKRLERQVARLS